MNREVGVEGNTRDAESITGRPRLRRVARPADRAAHRAGGSVEGALWDVDGVSAYLQVPVSSIYKMTARKGAVRIPHIRIGGKLRFRRSDVDQWLTVLTDSNLEALATKRQKV